MTPVALRRQISEEQLIMHAHSDTGSRTGNLAGYKGFAAQGRFVIKQNTIAGMHLIGFAIIYGNPVGIHLGDGIGRTGIKRSRFLLRNFLYQSVQLGRRSLIDSCFMRQAQQSYRLQYPQCTYTISVCRIFGRIETHFNMTHRGQVIYLVGLRFLNDTCQVHRIGHVAVMQNKFAVVNMRIFI